VAKLDESTDPRRGTLRVKLVNVAVLKGNVGGDLEKRRTERRLLSKSVRRDRKILFVRRGFFLTHQDGKSKAKQNGQHE